MTDFDVYDLADEHHDPDPGHEDIPVPEDADTANRMLRRLLRQRAHADQTRDRFNAEIGRLETARDDLTAGAAKQVEFLGAALAAYHAALVRDADMAGEPVPATVVLPAGVLKSRMGNPSLDIDDTLEAQGSVVPVVEKPATVRVDKTALLKQIKQDRYRVGEHGAIFTPEGDRIHGITYQPGTRNYQPPKPHTTTESDQPE